MTLLEFIAIVFIVYLFQNCISKPSSPRSKILLDSGWRFYKYGTNEVPDSLIYDLWPEVTEVKDDKDADSKPTEGVQLASSNMSLKAWVLPTGNKFVKNKSKYYQRPNGKPGKDFSFVQADFNDNNWEDVEIPHDWAVKGPFYQGWNSVVGGGMGRLPSEGVAWYRKKLFISAGDSAKAIFLQIDGAMSYSMVWCNGNLVGGWPYGYNSYQVDLTPYVVFGLENQIAIRIDNPNHSSRWYPGGGLYRNVWLIKTEKVHVDQWGTYITTRNVSALKVTIDLSVSIANSSNKDANIELMTKIYELGSDGEILKKVISKFEKQRVNITAGQVSTIHSSTEVQNPKLWGPPPTQFPNRYIAQTSIYHDGKLSDVFDTMFGIRTVRMDSDSGIFVNNEHIYIQGVNQHHDLGALGAAFNKRAAERQLELLREMGCNAVRLAHNPPDPQLLDLTDSMGFLVVNEIFDCWERKKTPLDFHLIFPDWHEQDVRSFIRRDRNHPSVIMWSLGNEVGEQYTGSEGASIAQRLYDIAKDEDPTRPTTISMNYAKPPMPLPKVMDIINLNYQGEGIRNAPAYAHLKGINTPPSFPLFHNFCPDKLILSSENAAAVSSRGEYSFPVTDLISAPVSDSTGGNTEKNHVSSYELYTVPFGSSADKVFASLEQHPYVGGGFVWSGWDYLGEPTPYYLSRSSYFGVIDLAGFKKDRFYLYQSHWRPDYPMAHILPHWNWPEREGEITPVHVFTSGDEAELFLNGESLGRKKKGKYEYRLRWDDIVYNPGELKVVAYKNDSIWARDEVKTFGSPSKLSIVADRSTILADGKDLCFITVEVQDKDGNFVANANTQIQFAIEGAGEIVATDNGDPTDMTPFPSHYRNAFNGLVLVIIKGQKGQKGKIKISATSKGLDSSVIEVNSL